MELKKLSVEQGESPVKALFFVYNGDTLDAQLAAATPGAEDPLAARLTTGVAALVAGDGTAVTCAHVVLLRELPLGAWLWLVHFETRIAVQATLLAEGWSGPDLKFVQERLAAGIPINPAELTPNELNRDLAFLSIDFASARKQLDGPAEADAQAKLLEEVRLLPLGVPGYKPGSKVPLTAWRAHWTNRSGNDLGAYAVAMAQAAFEFTDRSLGDTMQVHSDTLAPGFSGSPLWDPERGVAIGVVRQGIRAIMADRTLATDSRALTCHSSIRIDCDVQARRAIDALGKMFQLRHARRHRNTVGAEGARSWVEPQLQTLSYNPLEGTLSVAAKQIPLPALEIISDPFRADRHLLILGDAGTGKSRLLEELGSRTARAQAGAPTALPLLLTAQDLVNAGVGLAERVNHAFARSGLVDPLAIPLLDLLRLNGIPLLLFIDGIDELSKGARVQLIEEIVRAVRLGSDLPLKRIVVATRPVEEIEHPGFLDTFAALELLPFGDQHLEAFVNGRFVEGDERRRFTEALKDHRLFGSGGNPLQLTLASVVFRKNRQLPDNPVQLVREFVEIELARMRDESLEARQDSKSREVFAKEDLFLHSRAILDRVALASMQTKGGGLACEDVVGVITSLGGEASPEFADKTHLQLFVDKELAERGGLFRTDGTVVEWLHQTIVEHCAAEAIIALADNNKSLRDWAVAQMWDTARYGFILSLLGLLNLAGRRAAVEGLIRILVNRSTTKPRAVIIPLRFLATGAVLSEGLTREIVRCFVRILLANELRAECRELMTLERVSDIADAERLCRDSRIRPLILAAVEERLGARQVRSRPQHRAAVGSVLPPDPSVPISLHEDEILRRFELRDAITLPLRVRGKADNAGQGNVSGPLALRASLSPGAEIDDRGVAYFLEGAPGGSSTPVAMMPAREFTESLVEFTRRAASSLSPEKVVALYIAFILNRAVTSTPSDPSAE